MSLSRRSVGVIALIGAMACSHLPGAPAPAPTSTPRPAPTPISVFSATPTAVPIPVVYRPTPTPESDSIPVHIPSPPDPTAVAIAQKCFYPDTDVPDGLMAPLAEIVDSYTSRTVFTDRGTFRFEVGYFRDPSRGYWDDNHNPLPAPSPAAWSPSLSNHPFLVHDHVYLPPDGTSVIVRHKDEWDITLYGLVDVHPYYGGEKWILRAEATMDVVTCEATLERLVAGPDEIVLYPEDES